MIIFGGQDSGGAKKDDTWIVWYPEVNPTAMEWEQVTGSGPPGRTRHAAFWDFPRQRMVVIGGDTGGATSDDEVWELATTPPGSPTLTWVHAPDHVPGLAGQTVLYANLDAVTQPERFNPAAGQNGEYANAFSPRLQEVYYPQMFVLPSGNLLHPTRGYYTQILNTTTGTWSILNPTVNNSFWGDGAAMYRPGKVVKAGLDKSGSCKATAKLELDANDQTSGWLGGVGGQTMGADREFHNLTILPNGKVLVTGGAMAGNEKPEIWNPDADTTSWWSGYNTLIANPAFRAYHSTALLLPDGRVLTAGGIAPASNGVETKVTIFSPPYLFNAQGYFALRPVIDSAPTTLTWGQVFTVCSSNPSAISKVCLIRPGAVTHAFDQNQRYVPLTFSVAPSGPARLFVTAPPGPNHAPPGDYLLFIVGSSDGPEVPSIAQWVRLQGPAGADLCDATAPGTITVGPEIVGTNSIHLTWEATADDGILPASGAAKRFDLRASGLAINSEYRWSIAAQVPGVPEPGPFGTFHEMTFTGVPPCMVIHYSLRAEDDRPNLAALPPDMWVQIAGSGCGGATTSARPVDGRVEGGGPAPVTDGPARAGIGSATGPFSAGSAELAGSSSVQSPGAPLVVETRRLEDGVWQVSLRLATESDGLDPAASAITVGRERLGGGHDTLAEFRPGESELLFGLCALRERGRLAIPGFTQVERVMARVRHREGDYALTDARHSRLGSLGAEFVAHGGGVELLAGDVVDLIYAPVCTGHRGVAGYAELVRAGAPERGGTAGPVRPAPDARRAAARALRPLPERAQPGRSFDPHPVRPPGGSGGASGGVRSPGPSRRHAGGRSVSAGPAYEHLGSERGGRWAGTAGHLRMPPRGG